MAEKPRPVRPRPATWVWASVLMTFLCGGPIALLVWGAMAWSETGEPQPVDCAEAMEFARGALPANAADARCTHAYWQETRVTADFRMPREEYEPWLTATYPSRRPAAYCEHGLTGCVTVEYGEAKSVHVGVAYEDGDTVLVRLTASDH
ncbi:hypothetical protein ACFYV5_14250 [Streptomyces sp. NPDC003035]|uniref:hypothetical protein n=1 Tax=Streptomyces sp. NPDC003035 TaxID=3364676 RepID=UPI003695E605